MTMHEKRTRTVGGRDLARTYRTEDYCGRCGDRWPCQIAQAAAFVRRHPDKVPVEFAATLLAILDAPVDPGMVEVLPDDPRRSPNGVCYGFEDGLDGYAIHAEGCPDAGLSWCGPGYRCVRKGRWDGPLPAWARRGQP